MVVMLSKYWDSQPLHTTIVEILEKKQGVLADTELYKALDMAPDELSIRTLNRALMKLEVDGVIRVFELTKNKKRIELVKTQR
jgi:Fe2+ or Zn2+ uptake regulation protein